MKNCNRCGELKPLHDYYKSNILKDGHENNCKECKVIFSKESYVRNKEKVKLRAITKKYKLSEEEYYRLIATGCAVCSETENLCIDHDHSCCPGVFTCGNCIRGVLCRRCNTVEGMFKNNPELLFKLFKFMVE